MKHVISITGMICVYTLFFSLFFSACADHEPAEPGLSALQISFSISPSSLPTRSDNTPAISMTKGSPAENVIDSNDLFIAFFDSSGKQVAVAYDSASPDLFCISPSDESISVTATLHLPLPEGRLKIAIVANAGNYGMSDSFKNSSLSDLKGSIFFFPTSENSNENCLIPMYGEKEIDIVSEGGTSLNLGEIPLTRALAKIEIENKLTDGWSITEAALTKYSKTGSIAPLESNEGAPSSPEGGLDYGANLPFNKSADNNSFYLYVPEMELSDNPRSDERSIKLTLTNGQEEKECRLWIAPYINGEPSASDNPMWQRLLRNHIYRFSVTSFTPAIEISSTIRIIWYATESGKFSDTNPYINFWTSTSKLPSTIYWPNKPTVLKALSLNPSHPDKAYNYRYHELDLHNLNLSYDDIYYQILQSGQEYTEPEAYLGKLLSKDATRLENKDGLTYVWLNNPIIIYDYPQLPVSSGYRIYWKTKDMPYSLRILYKSTTIQNITDIHQDSRGYYYAGFKTTDTYRDLTYNIDYGLSSGNFSSQDIFIQNIDGKDYFVFYVN